MLLLAVPFVTSLLMQGVKLLAGMKWAENGVRSTPWLRFALIVLSLLGVVAAGVVSGHEVDPNQVTDLVATALETLVSAYISHAIYRSMMTSSK